VRELVTALAVCGGWVVSARGNSLDGRRFTQMRGWNAETGMDRISRMGACDGLKRENREGWVAEGLWMHDRRFGRGFEPQMDADAHGSSGQ
jgi:hypothetical protein